MALKNQAVVVTYYAYDTSANSGKTGDAINHTLRLYQDGAESTPAGTPAEVDATNCPGLYKIALTAAEMNYNSVTLHGKSSTANIVITPVQIITEAVSAAVLGATVPGSYTSGTLAYQVGRIGSASAVVQSSVSTSLAVTAIIGDDYAITDGTHIRFTITDSIDLTGATVRFKAPITGASASPYSKTCTITTATGASKVIDLELASAETALWTSGKYLYDIEATLTSGRIHTLVNQMPITVREDVR
jgi:hypothetical protein